MSVVVSCPRCAKSLKIPAGWAPGKRVRCRQCEQIFSPAVETAASKDSSEDLSPSGRPQRKKRRKPPTRKRKKSSAASGSNLPVILCAVAVGCSVLLISSVLIYRSVINRSADRTGVDSVDTADSSSVSTPPTVGTGPPISDDECRVFVEQMKQAIETSNLQEFQRLMNINAAFDKALATVNLPEDITSDVRRGAMQAVPRLYGQMFAQLTQGTYSWLQTTRSRNGTPQVLFRMSDDEGLNYHRIDLIRGTGQQIVGGDLFVFASGEYLSTTFKRVLIPLAASASRSFLEKLTGADNAFVKNLPRIQQMQQAAQQGSHAQALQICKSLPDELTRKKWLLLLRLQAASHVSDGEYVAAMEDFRRFYSDDVCLDLMLIDYYLLKNQIDDGLAAIGRLDQAVGGDPFLNTLRAVFFLSADRHSDARNALTPLLDNEQLAEQAYAALLDVDIAERDHAATAKTLSILEERFGYQFQNLASVPDFVHFVKSPEHQEWLKGRSGAGELPAQTPDQPQEMAAKDSSSPAAPKSMPAPSAPEQSTGSEIREQMEMNRSLRQVLHNFKSAIISRDAKQAATFIAPIEGSDPFIASLEGLMQNQEEIHRLMFTHVGRSKSVAEVTLALSPTSGGYDQIYFVKIEGEWKLSPTGINPPTDAQYQAAVTELTSWLKTQHDSHL